MNMIEALQEELKRNRELLEIYQSIGQPGRFASVMIVEDIKNGETAINNYDTVAMVKALKSLRGNQT